MRTMWLKKALTLLLAGMLLAGALAACKTEAKPAGPGSDATEVPAEIPTEVPEEEIDMSKFPLYVEPEKAEYAFGERGKSIARAWNNVNVYAPYWQGNIMYNETVLCIDDGTRIVGALQYKPVKVLSVRDYTMTVEYEEGKDYTLNGNQILLTRDSTACEYLTTDNLMGKDMPKKYRRVDSLSKIANIDTDYFMWTDNIFFTEGSLLWGHQLCVTYVYDIKDLDLSQFPAFGSVCPKFLSKLQSGSDAVITVTGDSVTEGCSASSKFNHEPMMPQFTTMMKNCLDKAYDGKITLKNYAVGGTTSNEAVSTNVSAKLVKGRSDLVLVHFGINDCGGVSAAQLKSNVKKVVDATLAERPDCEFLYIKCFTPNPALYPYEKMTAFWKAMDELAAEYENFYTLDLYTPSLKLLETKKYLDVTGNGINHPNDFVVRLYAMYLLAPFVDFGALSDTAD